MNRFSSLRVGLVAIVLVAVAPALALLVPGKPVWLVLVCSLFALVVTWLGSEWLVLRPIRSLTKAAKEMGTANFSLPTGLAGDPTELGELARELDAMAGTLEQRIQGRELNEKSLLDQAHQQTVIAALGQFALANSDLSTLMNQAVMLVSQTLEAEYCAILELVPASKTLRLRVGVGWKEGCVGQALVETGTRSQAGFTLMSGEPIVVGNQLEETRFRSTPLLDTHGVVSGVTVVIQGHREAFGVLGVHTSRRRAFTEEEVHFLMTTGSLLALAVDRQRTEPEIQKLAAFAKFNPNPVLEFSSEGKLTFFNEAAQTAAASLGAETIESVLPEETATIVTTCLATSQKRLGLETRPASHVLSWSFHPIMASQVVHCYVEDITERISLEEQLRQAQKMESVGQLASGVAHDFNNILTVIQGHSGLLMSRPNLSPAMTASIQAISFAAERATSLTRQLLTFGRKQVMQSKSLDLKGIVANMSKMLQRVIGETITLHCQAPNRLPHINGDAGMMEQILMNLCVNARDAMPKGGTVTISMEYTQVDEAYAKLHPNARVGGFVRLKVEDTGSGMDAATMKRIFEPFFTTKEAGKGTGLGLATVYGIVKQHSGWIEVTSQVGQGTTFNIFFPADTRPIEHQPEAETPTAEVRGGGETILVVEDEPVLRDLAQLILQDCGYRVLQAGSGVEALTVWQKHQGGIDLLLTDMIMPDGLSGNDLAESLLEQKPGLKIIFTSGYNVDELGGDPSQKRGSRFLQKPYSRSTLAKAVRECLDT